MCPLLQEEPISRPVCLPTVEDEDILKSASVPPTHVASMLAPMAEQELSETPVNPAESHILRDVVELLKVNSEAQSLESLRLTAEPIRCCSIPSVLSGNQMALGNLYLPAAFPGSCALQNSSDPRLYCQSIRVSCSNWKTMKRVAGV